MGQFDFFRNLKNNVKVLQPCFKAKYNYVIWDIDLDAKRQRQKKLKNGKKKKAFTQFKLAWKTCDLDHEVKTSS